MRLMLRAAGSTRDALTSFDRPAAFPSARLYFPPKAAAQWRKQGLITPEVEQRLFAYGTQGSVGNRPDPFEESTGGEIKSADFTHAHINEVRVIGLGIIVSCPVLCWTR